MKNTKMFLNTVVVSAITLFASAQLSAMRMNTPHKPDRSEILEKRIKAIEQTLINKNITTQQQLDDLLARLSK